MKQGHGLPRSALAVGLLSLTVVLVGVLAFQAIDAARSHRATAERVLEGYATLAAEQFAGRFTQVASYRAATPLLYALSIAGAGDPAAPLVAPTDLAGLQPERANPIPAEALQLARYSFRLDLASGALATGGETPPVETLAWMRDTVTTQATGEYGEEWPFAMVLSQRAGVREVIFYRRRLSESGQPLTAFGVGGRSTDLGVLFAMAGAYGSLLPASLSGGAEEEEFVGILVAGLHGDTLYSSELLAATDPGPYRLAGRFETEPHLGSLTIMAALVPDAAERLIIGGLPASRLPLLLFLLLLTVGLVGASLVMLSREYELARLRADLVSGVSHELRTPLAQIRMFAETMLLGRLRTEEEAHRSLRIIDQEARRLTHLVENLLHFARSEKGVTRIAPEPTALEPLVRETTEGFAPLAQLRSVNIETVADGEVVANVDRSAMQQMLLNLLDNAVKYGPDGQTVTIGIERDHDNAVVWVSDEGPGVPDRYRDRVWQRFWRQEGDGLAGVTGTGIGLAVVRELATLHGGATWVESAAVGAKFVISLPADTVGAGTQETGGT